MSAYKDVIAGKTCVYRAYIDGDLAYVGVTRNLLGRFSKHNSQRPWWRDVDRISLNWFDTRAEAFAAERVAIHTEFPLYNIARPKVAT